MNRRNFLKTMIAGGTALIALPNLLLAKNKHPLFTGEVGRYEGVKFYWFEGGFDPAAGSKLTVEEVRKINEHMRANHIAPNENGDYVYRISEITENAWKLIQ